MPKKLMFLVSGERADFLEIFKEVHLHSVMLILYALVFFCKTQDPYDIGKR